MKCEFPKTTIKWYISFVIEFESTEGGNVYLATILVIQILAKNKKRKRDIKEPENEG